MYSSLQVNELWLKRGKKENPGEGFEFLEGLANDQKKVCMHRCVLGQSLMNAL